MAWKTKEESTPLPPKHLHYHTDFQRHRSHQRNPQNSTASQRNPETTTTEVQTHRQPPYYTQRQTHQQHHRLDDLR